MAGVSHRTKINMPDLNKEKVAKILKLIGKRPEREIRAEVRNLFAVKKSQGNEIYKWIFALKNKKIASPHLKIDGEKAFVDLKGVESVKTLEDLVEYCKIDMEVWNPRKFTSNIWDGKLQIKAEFERKRESILKTLVAEIKEDLKTYSPIVPAIHKNPNTGELLLEVLIPDLHLGKLGWVESDGESFDLKIAREVFFGALHDMVKKAIPFGKFSKVVFWTGGDFLNVDNEENNTTKGTPQSVDSRFPKVFREGKNMLIEAIDYLKQLAPVDVVITRGNHDLNAMFHMGEVLEAYYHKDHNVKIDNLAMPRKYYRFGQNLICYAHGDKIDHKKLLSVAASESKDWSECKFREWHIGHLHIERVNSEPGLITRIIPSITGPDDYHTNHGYVKNMRRGQSFIWHKVNGLQCSIYSNAI